MSCRGRRHRRRRLLVGGLRGPLRRPLRRGTHWRRRAQPRQFPAVPLGQHRGQHQLRRHARRWRRRYLRDDVAGDPVRHLIAHRRVQLRCAGEELASQLGLVGTESGQLQRRRPPRQLRRHRRRRGQLRRTLADHHGAGEHVADAFSLGRQQATDHRGTAGEYPDLDHPGQRTKQRLAEAFRTTVLRHHPQPQRHLAQRSCPASQSRTRSDSRPTTAR